jgi:hypothetical protein
MIFTIQLELELSRMLQFVFSIARLIIGALAFSSHLMLKEKESVKSMLNLGMMAMEMLVALTVT